MHPGPKGSPLSSPPHAGWNLFDSSVAFPAAVLAESALDHNAATMRDFCARHGVSLAPHGKTTMAPALFRRQLEHGAWGITAATVWQAATMRAAGVERVLIANEVVVPAELRWLADAVADGFEVYCYVDSVPGLGLMTAAMAAAGATAPLPVLLEVGFPGGRTGVRGRDAALDLAAAVAAAPGVALTGVAGFEGVITDSGGRSAGELVDEFLDDVVAVARHLAGNGWFEPTPDVIVSAGGSAFFDRVVERFGGLDLGMPSRVVVRSGCYLTHDDGAYSASSPLGGDCSFTPAIEVWGAVLSRPEPTRALVGLGKRDASHDGLLPVAKKVYRRGGRGVEDLAPVRVSALNDQHAYLDLEAADPLAVGDLVGFGISHPCTTFDKWRTMLLVDDDYNVTGTVDTQF